MICLLGGTRTPNLMIRSHALYPIGLQGVNKIGFYRIIAPPPTTTGGRSFCYLTASISAYASASHFRRLVTLAYSIGFLQASLLSARCFNTPGYWAIFLLFAENWGIDPHTKKYGTFSRRPPSPSGLILHMKMGENYALTHGCASVPKFRQR